MFKNLFNFGGLVAVATLACGLAMPSTAQAQEGPNTGNVSWSLGADVTTQYWFRGIAQENQGFIIQPWFDVSFGVIEEENYSVDIYGGIWNSVHDGPTGAGTTGGDAWYEADVYIGTAIGLGENVSLDISYINLYSPAGGATFAEEIDIALGYDDSNLWGEGFGGLQPYILYAVEFDGASDGQENGDYLEIGVGPSFPVYESETMPVTLTVPVTVGLSLDDYYNHPTNGDDETFGFLDFGVDFSMPLAFIPAEYGSWDFGIGVHGILLGSTTEDLADAGATSGDEFEVYGSMGISMSY